MTRRCTRPEGGCKAEVEFLTSATSGRPLVVDAQPERRLVQGEPWPPRFACGHLEELARWAHAGAEERGGTAATETVNRLVAYLQEVLGDGEDHAVLVGRLADLPRNDARLAARQVNVYLDHHASCPRWAEKVERDRAARAAGSR
jgi:hypothetical protein